MRDANQAKSWDIVDLNTEDIQEGAGRHLTRMIEARRLCGASLLRGGFGAGLGLFDHVDNAVLGIQRMSQ